MSEKDIQILLDLAEAKLKEPSTKEEALERLVGAGIMDRNGEYTEPYRDLLNQAGVAA